MSVAADARRTSYEGRIMNVFKGLGFAILFDAILFGLVVLVWWAVVVLAS